MADYPDDVTEAMLDKFWGFPDPHDPDWDWRNYVADVGGSDAVEREREKMSRALAAADTAMLAHGWKRVPREPTDAMKLHGTHPTTPLSTWRAMYDAAPEVKS